MTNVKETVPRVITIYVYRSCLWRYSYSIAVPVFDYFYSNNVQKCAKISGS
jgi:hypothetical protein